ncbi:hypothetical protein B0H14DRAFT_3630159 [Mycena olivaceomarginata]|nr:hypothetical protein B0H14DRAFT_3630159 [Mycena olivaceomarginata]
MPKCQELESTKHWCVQHTDVSVPKVRYDGWIDGFPLLNVPVVQRVKVFLAPTTSRAFTDKDKYFIDTFEGQVRDYTRVRNRIKQLFLVSRSDRLSQFTRIVECLDLPAVPAEWDQEIDTMESPSSPLTPGRRYRVIDPVPDGDHPQRTLSEAQIRLLDQYCTSIARTRTLRSHLREVDEDLENYARTINTQATAECTYFRGFRDWCQVRIYGFLSLPLAQNSTLQIMTQLTNGLLIALIAVSTLGAGLVYSTIFSATRGDVGLMCYCFPFFSCGFLLPAIIQVVLQSGASLQNEVKFASQQFWTIVIGMFMALSSLAVIASLTILNVTVFLLKDDPASGDTIPDPPSTPVPGIIAFGLTGTIFLLLLTGALLTAIAVKAFTTLKAVRAVASTIYGRKSGHADALKVWLPV